MNSYKDIENPKILMKNNVLVQAKYSLTLVENRIFLLMMYKLQKESEGILSCEISHNEFRDIIKHAKDRTIKNISNCLSNLRKKSIFFMEEKENKKGIIWGEYGFLNGFTYDDETKIFKIDASKKIYDLLNNYIQTGYTPANLAVLFSLKNYYAQRLYDLLRLWSGKKTIINYSLYDLKMYLQLSDNYNEYGNFKRRVILPAIKELNETGYFEIDIKENKIGRKVDSIDFIVKDLDKRKYFTKNEIVKEIPNIIIEEVKEIKDTSNIIFNNFEFFIPDESVFTKGALRSFKIDFKHVDFENIYMEKAFNKAVMIALDKNDIDEINFKSYEFFKGTLENKIIECKIEEKEDIEHKKNIEMFWNC